MDPSLLIRRGGTRSVGGKTFRLVAGEWVDSAYDPALALATLYVRGDAERAALLSEKPGLRAYARMGPSVVVVFDGVVYRFQPGPR
jgi:hypothetical protein